MPQAKSIRDLMRIRAHNREFLESINWNLGTALGRKKRTGQPLSKEPAIIVFVPEKINPKWIPNSLIPKKLEGPDGLWCALDVVEGKKAEEADLKIVEPGYDELCERLRGWDNHICPGSQVSSWQDDAVQDYYEMGTLAAFAKRRSDGKLGFLTNMHVGKAVGKKLYHPVPWGTHLGTTTELVEFLTDEEWYGSEIDEPYASVRVDGAFVEVHDDEDLKKSLKPQMMGVGQLGPVKPISLDDMSIIGQPVLRVGRTTGLRRGHIVAFGYEFEDENEETYYTDLLMVGDAEQPFSTYGDSGSLIVLDNEELNPVGLLWGGWQEKLRTGYGIENWTYGISLSPLLDALKIDLVIEGRDLKE